MNLSVLPTTKIFYFIVINAKKTIFLLEILANLSKFGQNTGHTFNST